MTHELSARDLTMVGREALRCLEIAIDRIGRPTKFSKDWDPRPENGQSVIRSKESGAILRVTAEGTTFSFDTCFLRGGEQKMAGVDMQCDGLLPIKDIDLFSAAIIYPACVCLANITCIDAYEASKSLLMA